MTRVLVVNDDGIASRGIAVLAHAAADAGLDVVVAAPHAEASGTGAGLTVVAHDGGPVVRPAEEVGNEALPGVPCYAVAAHPAYITLAALGGTFGAVPDLVLSGVNRGANVGRAVLHSGTVGAALTAGVNGLRGMAVSLEADQTAEPGWVSAPPVIEAALPLLLDSPPGTVLNVNVPAVAPERLGDLTRARLASAGVVQTRLEREDASDVVTTQVGEDAERGTDARLLAAGTPTVTALSAVVEADRPVLPERTALRA